MTTTTAATLTTPSGERSNSYNARDIASSWRPLPNREPEPAR
jgi:hypothetical protein